MILFLIISLLFIATASAEPISGASYIGICNSKFPCARALQVIESQNIKAIGYLADSFGYNCTCVSEFMKTPGDKYVRVHLADGTCFPERGRKCGKFSVFRNESIRSAERKVLKKDKKLLARYRASIERTKELIKVDDGNIVVRYSLCLECPLSNKARNILLSEVLKYASKDEIVDSPLRGRCLPGVVCERHGDSPEYTSEQRCISDLDGTTLFEADLERLNTKSKQCEAIFYWSRGFNMLPWERSKLFVLPYKRTNIPNEREFEGLRACIVGLQ